MRLSNQIIVWLSLSLGLTFFSVQAEPLQKESKEITLESDTGFYDEKQGLSIYKGNVIIEQGTMRLEAEVVTVYMLEDRKINKLVATGAPVKFKQTPEVGKEDVHGHSLKAVYLPETRLLTMTQKARIWQGENSTESEKIVYDRVSEVITAGNKEAVNQRVHVILQPSSGSGVPVNKKQGHRENLPKGLKL